MYTSDNRSAVYLIDAEDKIENFVSMVFSELRDPDDPSFRMLRSILSTIANNVEEAITIVIEAEYVDRIYRDCYYNHLSSKRTEVSRFCKRLFLFDGDYFDILDNREFSEEVGANIIGTIVVKPIEVGAIGRTLVRPKYLLDSKQYLCRTTNYKATLYGHKMLFRAFPFSMQDGETLTCAEITILNLLDYYSNHFNDYKFALPSDITKVMNQNGHERALPAHGMSFPMISKTLFAFGFFPRLYFSTNELSPFQLKRLLHYYVESGIPVAVGIENENGDLHSVLVIGFKKYERSWERIINENNVVLQSEKLGKTSENSRRFYMYDVADSCTEYVMIDDHIRPYSCYNYIKQNGKYLLNNSKVRCIAVPLYKRMYLEALDARSIAKVFLSDSAPKLISIYKRARPPIEGDKEIGTKENPLIIRLFLASSSTYLEDRWGQGIDNDVLKNIWLNASFSHFLWICELYDKASLERGKTIGELVLDATASEVDKSSSIILFRFFDRISVRNRWGEMNSTIWAESNEINQESVDSSPQDMIMHGVEQGMEISMFSSVFVNC